MRHRYSLKDSGGDAALKTARSSYVHVIITPVKPSTANVNTVNIFKHSRLALPKLDMHFTRQ